MHTYPKKITILLCILITVLSACGENNVTKLKVEGSWILQGTPPWEEKWIVTPTQITYLWGTVSNDSWPTTNYVASIVSYDNNIFNSYDPETSSHGYAVIQYTFVDGPATGESGKYNIFRWKNYISTNSPITASFTVGTKLVGTYPNSTNVVFDTTTDAIQGATTDTGYFGYYSSGTQRQ